MSSPKTGDSKPELQPNVIALPGAFPLTDLGNAERLVAEWRSRIRYCPQRKKWLVYDGRRWAWDETAEIERCARSTTRRILAEAKDITDKDQRRAIVQHSFRSESAKSLRAMVSLAQSEAGVPVLLSELDANPYALNCANGTLNLRTGQLANHRPADLITKSTALVYDPAATSELWTQVVHGATGGDPELEAYLQRFVGYALIGEPLERVFGFLYGPPGTSKSTIIDALHAALGDYAHAAGFETWLQQSNVGGNRGDLVRLAGARLVTSVEVQNGARWDEALIKRVTGGDEIVAAAKFEGEVSFRATFTILLAANDAPSAREDDAGLWVRMRRIPLSAQVPVDKQDPLLKTKLREPQHAAAVLAWAVAGCLAYQRQGLSSCKAVEDSTAAYRSENDHFSEFLADCCTFEAGARVTRKALRERYEEWAKETGRRKLLSARDIASKLRDRGCIEKKVNGTTQWDGVRGKEMTDDRGQQEGQGAAGGSTPPEAFRSNSLVRGLENAAPKCPQVPLNLEPEEPW